MTTYVAYKRASTNKQGIDGLGMQAQEQAIAAYNGHVIAQFTEIESGKRADRPELLKALAHCKLTGSILIVAKLDRLTRNIKFLVDLMESGVEFIACDMPTANKTMLVIMVTIAEQELKAISARTTAALAVKKAWYKDHEGELKAAGLRHKLGTNNLVAERAVKGNLEGVKTIKENADKFAKSVYPIIKELQESGMSLRQIAAELKERHIVTARKTEWTAQAVKNAMAR